jgi:hypothetical protein
MGDEPEPLSWEETNSLYKKASVPFLSVLFVFMAYLAYLLHYYSPMSLFELVVEWVFPFIFAELFAWHISIEVLYHMRVRKSLRFHLRRLAVNSSFFLIAILPLLGVVFVVNTALSSYIGSFDSIMLGWILWMLVIGVFLLKFRTTLFRYWKAP